VQATKQATLHQLYEQLLFMAACYGADEVEIDLAQIRNEYVVALLEALLNEAEVTDVMLTEYNNLMQFYGILAGCDSNAQAVIDTVVQAVVEVQAELEGNA